MRTSEEIDAEIRALHKSAINKRELASNQDAKNELDTCIAEINKLQEFWNQEKEQSQDMMEETRQNYEADVYGLVKRVKNVEVKE